MVHEIHKKPERKRMTDFEKANQSILSPHDVMGCTRNTRISTEAEIQATYSLSYSIETQLIDEERQQSMDEHCLFLKLHT